MGAGTYIFQRRCPGKGWSSWRRSMGIIGRAGFGFCQSQRKSDVPAWGETAPGKRKDGTLCGKGSKGRRP